MFCGVAKKVPKEEVGYSSERYFTNTMYKVVAMMLYYICIE